jgi:polar amino acid transport system substrate-binding protein
VNDSSAVIGQMSNYPPNSLRVLPDLLSKLPLAFAVRYDSQDLLELVNLFFLNAGLDGRLEQNLNYWVNTLDWKKDH